MIINFKTKLIEVKNKIVLKTKIKSVIKSNFIIKTKVNMFIKRSIEPIILYLLIDFKGNVIKFIKITRKTSRVINNISSLEIENFLFNQ